MTNSKVRNDCPFFSNANLSKINLILENLVGWTSDGAAVMMGQKKGTAVRLEKLVERPVYKMWCGAHRLELDFELSFEGQPKKDPPIEGVPGQADFTRIINSVATNYGPMNHKKFEHFKKFLEQFHLPVLNFLKIFSVRWSTSVFEAIVRLDQMYESLMEHLLLLHKDIAREWKPAQRDKALAMYNELNDAYFLILLHLQKDILSPMSSQSLLYQKTHSTIIGEYNRQKLFSRRLEMLAEGKSKHLIGFLNEAKCTDNAGTLKSYLETKDSTKIESCGTIEKFESSPFKAFRGHRIYDRPNSPFKPLSQYLASYVDRLVQNHKKYMLDEQNLLEHFDELDQRLWNEEDEIPIDVGKPIVAIGEYFQVENFEILDILWHGLKYQIMNSIFYYEHKYDDPQEFWSSLLQSGEIRINDPMKRLIEISLVLTTSSADAERVFSVLTYVKNKYRNRMTPQRTENALRIKINGPELSKLDIYGYAQRWTDHHFYTDYIVGSNKKEKKEKKGFTNENLEDMAIDGITYSKSRLY